MNASEPSRGGYDPRDYPPGRRLAGHALLSRGAALDAVDLSSCPKCSRANRTWQERLSGHARCTCGAESGHLTYVEQRREWHRDHKHQVRTEEGRP